MRAACVLPAGYPLAVRCLRSCAVCVRSRAPCCALRAVAVCAVFKCRCFHQPPTGASGVAAKSGLSLSVFPPFFRRSRFASLFSESVKGLKISLGGVAVRTPAVGGRREHRKRQRRRLAFVSSSVAVCAVRGAAERCCGRRRARLWALPSAAVGAAGLGRRRCRLPSPSRRHDAEGMMPRINRSSL
jgi:hypothetical protein